MDAKTMFDNEVKELFSIQDELEKNYIESFSKISDGFYGETLREITRTRQNSLLVSSLVTIFVSLSILVPKGVDFALFSFELANDFSFLGFTVSTALFISIIVKLFTVYFLVVYIFSIVKDVRYHQHKSRKPAELEMKLLRKKVSEAIAQRLSILRKVSGTVSEIVQARREKYRNIWSDYSKLSQSYNERREKLSSEQFQILLESGFKIANARQEDIDKLYEQEREEALQLFKQRDHLMKTDGVDEGQKILEGSLFNFEKEYGNKVQEIIDTYKRYRRYNFLSTLIEVVFPIFIAVVAILLAL